MENTELEIKEMRDGIYLLDEGHMSTGYLVVGNEKACLIDTMNGNNDLKKLCTALTDKPVMVVNTHGHPDHIFGNVFFDEAYIHPADRGLMDFFVSQPDFAEDMKKKNLKFPEMHDISEGEVIDLGGRTLKVYHLAGHTQGSILLLCPEERILFTGDAINHHLWMQLDGCSSIREMADNLEKLLFLENEADLILHGHAHDFDDISLMSAVLNGAKEIVSGKTQNDSPYKWFGGEGLYHPFVTDSSKKFQQADHGICYVKENI